MQFQIPQFIDTEAKIIGPLTIKQFLIIAGAIGLSFILFYVLQMWLWTILAVLIIGGAIAFAMIKVNGQPLTIVAFSAFKFFWKPKLYIWKKEEKIERNEKETTDGEKSLIESLRERLLTSKMPVPKREKRAKGPMWQNIFGEQERFEVLRRITGDKEVARRVDYR
jgi:hypothetical protein